MVTCANGEKIGNRRIGGVAFFINLDVWHITSMRTFWVLQAMFCHVRVIVFARGCKFWCTRANLMDVNAMLTWLRIGKAGHFDPNIDFTVGGLGENCRANHITGDILELGTGCIRHAHAVGHPHCACYVHRASHVHRIGHVHRASHVHGVSHIHRVGYAGRLRPCGRRTVVGQRLWTGRSTSR